LADIPAFGEQRLGTVAAPSRQDPQHPPRPLGSVSDCWPQSFNDQYLEATVYHTIEFHNDLAVDLEVSPKQPLEQLRIRKGTRVSAQVKPSVIETSDGPVEVADLFFEDGSTARSLPFGLFSFVD
jgi:hypothetical protein